MSRSIAETNWRRIAIAAAALVTILCAAAQQSGEATSAAAAAESKYLFARGLLHRRFHDMAADEFRGFLADYSNHELAPQAARGLVKSLQGMGRTEDALAEIEVIRTTWPTHAVVQEIMLDKGYLLLQLNRPDEAGKAFSTLTSSPDSEVQEAALYFLAQANEKTGDAQQAMRIYLSLASKPLDSVHRYRPYAVYAVMSSEVQADLDRAAKRLEKLLASPDVEPSMKEQALFLCADKAWQRRDHEMAGKLYGQIADRFPDSPKISLALKGSLRVMHAAGLPEECAEFARKLRLRDDLRDDPEVAFMLASALLRLRQPAAAEGLLRQLGDHPEIWPELRRQALLLRLQALLESRRFEDAIAAAGELGEPAATAQDLAAAAYFRGVAEFELERYEAAAASLSGVAGGDATGAEAVAARDHARHLLAVCLGRLGRRQEAAVFYRLLAGEAPFDPLRANHLLSAALEEEGAGDFPAAIGDCEKVLAGTPPESRESLAAVNALVRLSFKLGEFKRTIEVLGGLVGRTRGETRSKTRLTLALALLQADRLDEADQQIAAAVQEGATGKIAAELHFVRVRLALKKDDMAAALDHFSTVWAMPEATHPDWVPAIMLRLQEEFYRRGDYATSEAICRKLLDMAPEVDPYIPGVRRAEILLATNRLDEAKELLDGLAGNQADPGRSAEILSLIGEILLRQERHDLAFRAFERSLEKGGGGSRANVRARWGMAMLLKREGRDDDALRQAVGAFVLGDDPFYTPRAMFLAVEILRGKNQLDEAETTWRELEKRFPEFAEKPSLR